MATLVGGRHCGEMGGLCAHHLLRAAIEVGKEGYSYIIAPHSEMSIGRLLPDPYGEALFSCYLYMWGPCAVQYTALVRVWREEMHIERRRRQTVRGESAATTQNMEDDNQ